MATKPTRRPELLFLSLPMSLSSSKQNATANQAPTTAVAVKHTDTVTAKDSDGHQQQT